MELFKLLGTIAIDNQKANEDIDETTGRASQAESRMVGAFKKIGAAVVTGFAVDKIKDFGLACINAAADANAMESQFTQVFGEMEAGARTSLSAIAESSGISENRIKGSFTQIASFAKTTGMETTDALALSERAMIAVADSAAFYDRSLEDTTESLQSFLKGNYENDAALGLSCTEVTRNTAANELFGVSFIELSEAQKQLTLLKMVEDANALSGAMGQASRESNTWANQTGNLKQAWTNFTAAIGKNILPIAIQFVGWLAENMPIAEEYVVKAIDKVREVIKELEPTVKLVFEGITTLWNTVLKPVLSGITDFLMGVFTGDWKRAWEGVANIVKGVWNGIWSVVKGVINSMLGGIESWINGIIGAINKLISAINAVISKVGFLMGVTGNIPTIKGINLPRLEKGGVLEKGQVGLLEGNGAEAVVPLDQNRAWISAVAKDMNTAVGGDGSTQLLERILSVLHTIDDNMTEKMQDAFASMKFDVNNREFARLVKAVN